MNGGGFYSNPEVPVDRPLLGVGELGNAAREHCRGSDVLAKIGRASCRERVSKQV